MTDTANNNQELRYYEVDITYTAEAKMVLLGKDEDDIRSALATDFPEIPNLQVVTIGLADQELVKQAKAQREWYDQVQATDKAKIN